ncbi:hypothetical protein J7A65_004884 [Escherichia coli]|nr:hypothetical protein [Escherichia coli]EHH5934890.1 hypothetical protein [Escherichia coli]
MFVGKTLLHGGVLMWLMKTLLTSRCINQRGAGQYLRAEKLGQLDNFFTHICQLVALITIGLLFIGVLNAPINAYEMVIYPIAFFVCLFGQMRLFRSV